MENRNRNDKLARYFVLIVCDIPSFKALSVIVKISGIIDRDCPLDVNSFVSRCPLDREQGQTRGIRH